MSRQATRGPSASARFSPRPQSQQINHGGNIMLQLAVINESTAIAVADVQKMQGSAAENEIGRCSAERSSSVVGDPSGPGV